VDQLVMHRDSGRRDDPGFLVAAAWYVQSSSQSGRTSMAHPNGMFSWTDISLADVSAGKEFYQQLFGWESVEQHDPDGNLIYVLFSKDGDLAAGMGPMPPEMQAAGFPPMWQSYVSVDSVDDVGATVIAAGGSEVLPAVDVYDSGRMAILADPTGAVFSIWQAGNHAGADRFNDPGFMTWNELATRDADAAQRFYGEVFGWTAQTDEMPTGMLYTMFSNGDRPNGGMLAMDENWPAEIPAHWMVYFRVGDIDEALGELTALGGSISVEPFDTPAGRTAVVGDPQGGTFSIIGPALETPTG